MSGASRRAFVLAGASSVLAAGGPAAAQPRIALTAWLSVKAAPVRTIDPADEDFADLEPLAVAIGAARVVQLGEPSHGAGSAFAAKARLVKFLQRRLGFDLLIWELGLYDASLAQAAMRSIDDPMAAARRGIFSLWSKAAEVRPLFEFIKASQAGPHPIEMAGFDMQVTADGSVARFAEDLRAFVSGPRDPDLRRQASSLADQALAARDRLFASHFKDSADLQRLAEGAHRLRALIRARHGDFDAVRGEPATAFMDRAIDNMRADAAQRFKAVRTPETTPARESQRDALNAANLLWLLRARYAGRKAVVWAHNAHVMNAGYAPGFHEVHLPPRRGDMIPTGVFIARALGPEVYTLGLTAYEGQEGFATGGPASRIPPAPEGGLEAGLHALGHPYAFLDFRGSRNDRRSPFRGLQTARLPKFESVTVADIDRIYDGVFFIDHMSPAMSA